MVTKAELRLALPAFKVASRNAQSAFGMLKLDDAEGSFKRWFASFDRCFLAGCQIQSLAIDQIWSMLNPTKGYFERCVATLGVRAAGFKRDVYVKCK